MMKLKSAKLLPRAITKTPHQTRNRAMVDRSDLVVFCIQHEIGGAWQTMEYAKKQGISYINIADPKEKAE